MWACGQCAPCLKLSRNATAAAALEDRAAAVHELCVSPVLRPSRTSRCDPGPRLPQAWAPRVLRVRASFPSALCHLLQAAPRPLVAAAATASPQPTPPPTPPTSGNLVVDNLFSFLSRQTRQACR